MARLNSKYLEQPLFPNLNLHIACIFMDDVQSTFLETQSLQPLIWFRYIEDLFFIWTHGEEKLQLVLTNLSNYIPHIKFTYEFNKEYISFLDLKVSFCDGKRTADLHVYPLIDTNNHITRRRLLTIHNDLSYTVRH